MSARTMGSVLIVTEAEDLHGDALAATLRKYHGHNPIRLDMRDFPRENGTFRLGMEGSYRSLSHVFGLEDVTSVWWRRPHPARYRPV